jgi:RNA methyltransferase, TrmH family
MQRISSRRNSLVARYRAAADGDPEGVLLLDGVHLLAEALDAGLTLHHVTYAIAALATPELAGLAARLGEIGVEQATATTSVMAAMSPVRSPSAVVALAERRVSAPRPASPALAVIAAGVQDPGNLGAIIRVAEAGGATHVVAAGATADPFGWKALRGAMGSTFRLPVERVSTSLAAVEAARARGWRVVALVPRGGVPLFACDLGAPTAVLIGSEGTGLTDDLLAAADVRVTIPMTPPVESLNAAVATALVVYEARRQRTRHQPGPGDEA